MICSTRRSKSLTTLGANADRRYQRSTVPQGVRDHLELRDHPVASPAFSTIAVPTVLTRSTGLPRILDN